MKNSTLQRDSLREEFIKNFNGTTLFEKDDMRLEMVIDFFLSRTVNRDEIERVCERLKKSHGGTKDTFVETTKEEIIYNQALQDIINELLK